MKKVLFLTAIASVVALSSCKKDYTCTCTIFGQTAKATIKDTKKKAKDACSASETSAKASDASATCKLD